LVGFAKLTRDWRRSKEARLISGCPFAATAKGALSNVARCDREAFGAGVELGACVE
jgi:hypothetical protein